MSNSPSKLSHRQMQSNRFEYKYLIDPRTARAIRDFAQSHLSRDDFARAECAWAYPTHSVYLDGPHYPLYKSTLDGHKNRFKLRVRYYDEDPAKPVYFEIKRRSQDAIIKERSVVHRQRALAIMEGNIPVREDLVKPENDEQWASLRRFVEMRDSIGAMPRAVVSYTREAWIKPQNNHVRLTFDRELRGAAYRGKFEAATEVHCPPLVPGAEVILELKFTERFPTWFSEMAQAFQLQRRSMAKYCRVIQLLPGHRMG